MYGGIAQLVEQRTFNPSVQGSSPCAPTMAQTQDRKPTSIGFSRGTDILLPEGTYWVTEEVIERANGGERITRIYKRHEIRWTEDLPLEMLKG